MIQTVCLEIVKFFVHFRSWGRCSPVLNESGHFDDLYTVIACMGLCHNPSRELKLFIY